MVYKCKMCGGDLRLVEGNSTAQCEYCGSMQTVPSADNEKKMTLFSRANRLRSNCEFDKASGVYESIVADFPEEAEAYWGLVLCKYGIEYVDDPANGKKVPTCHRSSFESLLDDNDFEQTLENADTTARKVYRDEAKQIEEIRKGIIAVSSNEEPYDIFICYKETTENGDRTLDSVLAQDIYEALSDKGYRVFFSRITLEDKLGQEYEPYIFAALNSARVMLAIGTDYEYYNAVWVKNEWSRYLKLIAEDHSRHLIPCYKGIDAYDMPKEFAKLQAQDLGKVGAIQDLLRGVDKLISPAAPAPAPAPKGAEIGQLLTMGSEALEKGEWSIASNRFDLALTVDPMCAEAYLGKLMAECKCQKREQLMHTKKRLKNNIQYKQALTYADEHLKQELQSYYKKTEQCRCRRIARWIIVAIAGLVATVCVFMVKAELDYRAIVDQFYSESLDAESTYNQLEQLSWFRQVDKCTQFLLEKRSPGLYPDAILETDLVIPNGVTIISARTFQNYAELTSITIPDSVIAIGNSAFYGCSGLTSITIPDSVTTIGNRAFFDCSSLTSITIPDSVTTIGDRAFQSCTRLTNVTIQDGVTTIGDRAFQSCTHLTNVTIPDSVTTIGESAFQSCAGLTNVTIPDSVTVVGDYAFYYCDNLKHIYCEAKQKPVKWKSKWALSVEQAVIWGVPN